MGLERLAEFYKAADMFVLMSTAETQSVALMQAYASGLPAITARAGALPHYTPAEAGYTVEPGDVHALAAHIKKLLSDSALREKLGEGALAFVKKFSPASIAGEWENIFKEAKKK